MELKRIGMIHSPFKTREEAPKSGRLTDRLSEIEIFDEYAEGLLDIETASHLIVLYWFDRANRDCLIVKPPRDDQPHGVFVTRSPCRPNPIAVSVVDFVERKGNRIVVKGLEALDQTPLLDVKMYNAESDSFPDATVGWLKDAEKRKKS